LKASSGPSARKWLRGGWWDVYSKKILVPSWP